MRALVRGWLLTTVLAGPAPQQPPSPAPPPADVAGRWVMTLDMSVGVAAPEMTIVQDGEKLSGTYRSGRYGEVPLAGTIRDRTISVSVTIEPEGQTMTITYSGEVAEDRQTMKGRATLGPLGDGTWTAARAAAH